MQRSILSKSLSGVFAKRAFSQSPRLTIAQNLLKLNAVRAAKDESSLNEALKASYKVDANVLPSEIESLGGYFAAAPAAASQAEFVADPTAWQNMSWWQFVAAESQRSETWPFVVGGV